VSEAGNDELERLEFNMRDEARREYTRIVVEVRSARILADAVPWMIAPLHRRLMHSLRGASCTPTL
jgi:hypothetical protein